MSRPLIVLGLGVAVAAVVGLGLPGVALPRPATRDSVVAVGSTTNFTSFDLRWSSGPFGERPTGTIKVVFQGTTYGAGPPSLRGSACLRVRGNTATIAAPTSGYSAYPYGMATMVDHGPRGDTFAAIESSSPLDCSTPTTALLAPLLTGSIIVVDAQPTATTLRASLAVAPRPPQCGSSAVRATVDVTGGTSLARVTLSLDARPVARRKRRRFGVRVPVSALRPGPHKLRAVVVDSAGDEARAVVTVRRCRDAPSRR